MATRGPAIGSRLSGQI